MKSNQAVTLLMKTATKARDQSERYWVLVLACQNKYPSDSEYARKREKEHLQQAAYYEDKLRDCEQALQDLKLVAAIKNELNRRKQVESPFTTAENIIPWEPFDDDMIPDLPLQTNYLISNGKDIWVGQLDYGPHDSIKWYMGDTIINDIKLIAYIGDLPPTNL